MVQSKTRRRTLAGNGRRRAETQSLLGGSTPLSSTCLSLCQGGDSQQNQARQLRFWLSATRPGPSDFASARISTRAPTSVHFLGNGREHSVSLPTPSWCPVSLVHSIPTRAPCLPPFLIDNVHYLARRCVEPPGQSFMSVRVLSPRPPLTNVPLSAAPHRHSSPSQSWSDVSERHLSSANRLQIGCRRHRYIS